MYPTRVRLITIFGIKENIPNLKITWTLIFLLFVESDLYLPTPTVAHRHYLLTSFKES